jgi:hypothetical protein
MVNFMNYLDEVKAVDLLQVGVGFEFFSFELIVVNEGGEFVGIMDWGRGFDSTDCVIVKET